MQENFEGYREELDQVKLTEESKRALVRSLQNRKEDEMRKNGRKPVRIRRVAAVAAVICLLTTGAVAAVTASPTLRDRIFGDSAAYEQSSAFIGRSVETGGDGPGRRELPVWGQTWRYCTAIPRHGKRTPAVGHPAAAR